MARQRVRLTLTHEQEAELNRLWEDESLDARSRQRLLVVRTARMGNNTYEDIAEIAGCSRRTVGRWFESFEAGGLEGLLERGKPLPPPTPLRQEDLERDFKEQLLAGNFRTAKQAQRWLKEKHGIVRTIWSIYYWLKEFGASLLVPRPVHIKKDQKKAELFPQELQKILASLPLVKGRPVRIWVQDEGRIGLHTIVRRAWGLRGHRIIKQTQKKYQWGYVFGAMEIGTGKIEYLVQSHACLDSSMEFLKYLADSEPDAEHVVIWDGAGFHQKQGKHPLPDRVHVIQLPPYSPELNPIEKLWDILKDGLCNRIFHTFDELEVAIYAELQQFYDDASKVLQLIGNSATVASANDSFLVNRVKMNYKWSNILTGLILPIPKPGYASRR